MTAVADVGFDFSFSRPNLAEGRQAGAAFVIRYSSGAASATSHSSHPSVAGKLITPGEFKALLAAGYDVIANDEWYESRVTEGAVAAREDAAAAMALWRSCGLNKGASIYVSWDAAPVPSAWPAVDAYLRQYEATLAGYYHVDCYAGTPYLRHALAANLIRYGWRPNAGSWSGDGLPYQPNTAAAQRPALATAAQAKTPARMWQTGNYWFSNQADENLIIRAPVGSHRDATAAPTPTPTPTPTAVGEKMYRFSVYPAITGAKNPGCVYLTDGLVMRWIQDPVALNSMQALIRVLMGAHYDVAVHISGQPRSAHGVIQGPDPEATPHLVAASPVEHVDGYADASNAEHAGTVRMSVAA